MSASDFYRLGAVIFLAPQLPLELGLLASGVCLGVVLFLEFSS